MAIQNRTFFTLDTLLKLRKQEGKKHTLMKKKINIIIMNIS